MSVNVQGESLIAAHGSYPVFEGDLCLTDWVPLSLSVSATCTRCGYISSNELCKACVMLEGLNKGRPR